MTDNGKMNKKVVGFCAASSILFGILILDQAASSNVKARDNFVLPNQAAVITEDWVGCTEWNSYTKFTKLVIEKDWPAALRFAQRSSDCKVMKESRKGTVTDRAIGSNAYCFRETGEPECYWVPMMVVTAVK